MKRVLMACAIPALAMSGAVMAKNPVERATYEARVAAVNGLQQKLSFRFVGEELLSELMSKVNGDMTKEEHERLIALQERLALLHSWREQMLKFDGMTEDNHLVLSIDADIISIEKELDSLVYDRGLMNWKSGAAGAIALMAGYLAGRASDESKIAQADNKIREFAAGWTPDMIQQTRGFLANHLPGEKHMWRGFATMIVTFVAIEWMLRGRYAIGIKAGSTMAQWIAKTTGKVMVKMFGEGGYIDRFEQWLEESLHGVGAKLDSLVVDKISTPVALGVIVASCGLIGWYFGRDTAQDPQKGEVK